MMREVMSTEPFLEAFPSVMILTVIWTIAKKDESFTNFCIENPHYYECPVYNNTKFAPPEYCDQNRNINRCAVYGGFGGYWWFFTTFLISLLTCSLGVAKFLQNGPISVISNKGPLGGMMTRRFGLAFITIAFSIFTKVGLLAFYCHVFMQLDTFEQGNELKSTALASIVSFSFGLLVLPHIMLSFISIGFSTGLNKKLIEILICYPATWMLPVCSLYVIGPRKLTCDSRPNDQRRKLVLSKQLSLLNMMLTLIMGIMFILITSQNTSDLLYFTERIGTEKVLP